MKRRDCIKALTAIATTTILGAKTAQAQISGKTGRLIVGFAPGGTGDVMGRGLLEAMRRAGGPQTIVENKPGASGRIAIQTLKSATPDNSTILLTPGWVATLTPNTDKAVVFDPFADLVPIGAFSSQDYALAVGGHSPVRNIADFVRMAKADPTVGQYASAGVGSMAHVIGASFERSAGCKMTGIPYRGAAISLQDLQAGHVPANIGALGDMVRMHREGSVRVLATTGNQRSKFLPDVPTFDEAGYQGMQFTDWTGLFFPAKTGRDAVTQYTRWLSDCTKDRAFITLLEQWSTEARYQSPDELTTRMRADFERFRELSQSLNLKNST
jgi:tripartite-type tricarboxylate transporter receptor subunit TctC